MKRDLAIEIFCSMGEYGFRDFLGFFVIFSRIFRKKSIKIVALEKDLKNRKKENRQLALVQNAFLPPADLGVRRG